MKLLINSNQYKASNNELNISDDLKEVSAYSYDWWEYVSTDTVGNIVFNNTSYSHSTSRHQDTAHSLLIRLGIKPDLILNNTRLSLSDIKEAVESEIENIRYDIDLLFYFATKKGSHKRKNKERLESIKKYTYRIKDLERYLTEYYNKKPLPKNLGEITSFFNIALLYNHNDKLNKELKKSVLERMPYLFRRSGLTRPSINRIKDLLGQKRSSCNADYIIYPYTNDLFNMLKEHMSEPLVERRVKQLTKNGVNTLVLDKLHTYLINKMNRKTYTPIDKNEKQYRINPKLERIEELKPIINRYQLRQESKTQNHCIGTVPDYHKRLLTNGNQAFNFKGYTFYTDYNLNIIQCKGKYNKEVPNKIINELKQKIGA